MQRPLDKELDVLFDIQNQLLISDDRNTCSETRDSTTDLLSLHQNNLDALYTAIDDDDPNLSTVADDKIHTSGRSPVRVDSCSDVGTLGIQLSAPSSSESDHSLQPRLRSMDFGAAPKLDKTLNVGLVETYDDLEAMYNQKNLIGTDAWVDVLSVRNGDNRGNLMENYPATVSTGYDTDSPTSSRDLMTVMNDNRASSFSADMQDDNVLSNGPRVTSPCRGLGKPLLPKKIKTGPCKKSIVGGSTKQSIARASVRVTPSRRRKKAEFLNNITDDELTALEIPQLIRFGKMAGFAEDRIKELKIRRRKLKNRCSARGSAQKRRTEFRSVVSSHQELEDEYVRLQQEHTALLRTHGMLMAQAQAVRQIAEYEAQGIQDLTARVEELQAAAKIQSDSIMHL